MKTVDKVREELIGVRHYYANRKVIESAYSVTGRPMATELIERYNQYIKRASIRLYSLYVGLYLNNNSQETVAVDWNCSTGYIKVLNRKLYEFFVNEFNKEESTK